MGRRKISITKITQERSRLITLTKRKTGLFKKAYELSVLCDCAINVVIHDPCGRVFVFSSNEEPVSAFYRHIVHADEYKSNANYHSEDLNDTFSDDYTHDDKGPSNGPSESPNIAHALERASNVSKASTSNTFPPYSPLINEDANKAPPPANVSLRDQLTAAPTPFGAFLAMQLPTDSSETTDNTYNLQGAPGGGSSLQNAYVASQYHTTPSLDSPINPITSPLGAFPLDDILRNKSQQSEETLAVSSFPFSQSSTKAASFQKEAPDKPQPKHRERSLFHNLTSQMEYHKPQTTYTPLTDFGALLMPKKIPVEVCTDYMIRSAEGCIYVKGANGNIVPFDPDIHYVSKYPN